MIPCPACKATFEDRPAMLLHRLTYHGWRGFSWCDEYGPIRVMTVCENYAMVRRKGCVPSVIPVKEIPWELEIQG